MKRTRLHFCNIDFCRWDFFYELINFVNMELMENRFSIITAIKMSQASSFILSWFFRKASYEHSRIQLAFKGQVNLFVWRLARGTTKNIFCNFLKASTRNVHSKVHLQIKFYRSLAFTKWTVGDVFLRVKKICFLELAHETPVDSYFWSCCLLSHPTCFIRQVRTFCCYIWVFHFICF